MKDPNFEQNRIEYKANKDAADRGIKNGRSVLKKAENGKHLNWGYLITKVFIFYFPHKHHLPRRRQLLRVQARRRQRSKRQRL